MTRRTVGPRSLWLAASTVAFGCASPDEAAGPCEPRVEPTTAEHAGLLEALGDFQTATVRIPWSLNDHPSVIGDTAALTRNAPGEAEVLRFDDPSCGSDLLALPLPSATLEAPWLGTAQAEDLRIVTGLDMPGSQWLRGRLIVGVVSEPLGQAIDAETGGAPPTAVYLDLDGLTAGLGVEYSDGDTLVDASLATCDGLEGCTPSVEAVP